MYEEQLKQYKEEGFCKIDSFFSAAEIEQIVAKINEFIAEKAKNLSGRDINWTGGQVNSIHCLANEDNFFTQIARSEKVTNLAKVFLEDESDFRAAELFAKPAKVGLPSPYHQDNFYWCVAGANALTIWVALDYCDATNGGLIYFKGSHKLGVVDHKDSNAPGSSQTIADEELLKKMAAEKVCLSLKPGDCLIHHSLIIHGSEPNQSERSRRGFTMQFKGKSAGYDLEMKKHYESRLMAQIEARKAAVNTK